MKKYLFSLLFIFSCMGVHAQLGYWNNKGLVEMTPVESIVYKFVWPMDDESRETMRDLYASMKKIGDKSILNCSNFSGDIAWYVKNDYPLPDGNYFVSDIYDAQAPNGSNALDGQLEVVLPQINCYVNWRGRVEDLLEYLGDQVTVDYISEPDLSGGTTCRFICNLKTSKEALELGMRVHDINMEGVRNFHSRVFFIDKIYDSYLISVMTESNENDVNLIYSMNWEGVDYPMTDISPDDPWKTTNEGLAIYNPEKQEYAGSTWTIISGGGFSLEKNHDYVVRLTMKVPSDGTYQVNMGSWATNVNTQVPVTGSDDFQVIDAEFPLFASDAENVEGLETCHVILQNGWVVGTTVIKKVEVYEKPGSGVRDDKTAVNAVKATNADGVIYNLAGQKVDTSYKGIVIRNGQKRLAR